MVFILLIVLINIFTKTQNTIQRQTKHLARVTWAPQDLHTWVKKDIHAFQSERIKKTWVLKKGKKERGCFFLFEINFIYKNGIPKYKAAFVKISEENVVNIYTLHRNTHIQRYKEKNCKKSVQNVQKG